MSEMRISQHEVYDFIRLRSLMCEIVTVRDVQRRFSAVPAQTLRARISTLKSAGMVMGVTEYLTPECVAYLNDHGIKQAYIASAFEDKIREMYFSDLNLRAGLEKPIFIDEVVIEEPPVVQTALVSTPQDQVVEEEKEEVQEVAPAPAFEKVLETVSVGKTPKPVLPMVTIVGLLPRQEQHIQQRFGKKICFNFVSNQDKGVRLRNIRMGSDLILFHTDHMSHNTTANFRNLQNSELLTGSVSTFIKRIERFLSER